jgi:hypothetical protein
MPEPSRFDIDRVREFARERVEMMTLREVAADIGMSYSGLFSFLQGGEPYSRNRQRLAAWYVRVSHTSVRAIEPEEVDAAVALLDEYIHAGTSDDQARKRAREICKRLLKPARNADRSEKRRS